MLPEALSIYPLCKPREIEELMVKITPMYVNGTRFEVKLPIRHGDQIYEKGLKGTITGHVNKMIGKAYTVEFDDGRNAELHMVIVNNQTEIETPEA